MYKNKKGLTDKDNYCTPKYLFNYLNNLYDFDVDLASDDENCLCECHFTTDNSPFDYNWSESTKKRIFCNPPYSNITPWVELAVKLSNLDHLVVMLLPSPNGEIYHNLALNKCTSIIHIIGRISFINQHDGKEMIGNNRGSCIYEFRKKYLNYAHHSIVINRDEIKLKDNYNE